MMADYLLPIMIKNFKPEQLNPDNVMHLRNVLGSYKTTQKLKRITEVTSSWETIKDVATKPEVQEYAISPLPFVENTKAVNQLIENIPLTATEKKFKEERAELEKQQSFLEERWNENHKDPMNDWYHSSTGKRKDMVVDYLKISMMKKGADISLIQDEKFFDKLYTDMVLKEVCRCTDNWETCQKLLDDTQLHEVLPVLSNGNDQGTQERAMDDYLSEKVAPVKTSIEELRFREEHGSIRRSEDLMKENTKKIQSVTNRIANNMKKVDYNLLGSGSKQFNKMNKEVQELNKFCMDDYSTMQGYVSEERHKNLIAQTELAITSIKNYLSHKQEQLTKDPKRINDPSKQKREQPRIANSINTLVELEELLFEQKLQLPGTQYRDKSGDEAKRQEFKAHLEEQKKALIKGLCSDQMQAKMGMVNEQSAANASQKVEMTQPQAPKVAPPM